MAAEVIPETINPEVLASDISTEELVKIETGIDPSEFDRQFGTRAMRSTTILEWGPAKNRPKDNDKVVEGLSYSA